MQVKEEQKRGTEGEQRSAEFKWLTLEGRNNKAKQRHDASEGGPKEGTEGEQRLAEFKWLTLEGRYYKAKEWYDASEGGPKEAKKNNEEERGTK